MESSNSESENECFESAEESIEDEKDDVNTISNKSLQDRESELPDVPPPCNTVNYVNQVNEEKSGNLLSYRKRPERVSRSSKPSNKTTSKSLDELIFKADKIVSDVFLQDITSNLSKNINRSLSTLQQTSSNVKELIFSTIPVSSHNDEGFSYDDKNLFSSADTVLDNKHFDSTGHIEDHVKKKEESNQVKISTKEISFSLADKQSDDAEDRKLSSTGTDNLENNLNKVQKDDSKVVVLENIIKKEEYNLEQLQNLENSDSAYLNSDYKSKGTKDSNEDEVETTTDKIENFPSSNERSLNTGNYEVYKGNDQEDTMNTKNSFAEAIKCSPHENLECMELDIKEKITNEPGMNEKELAEDQNPLKEKFDPHAMVKNSDKVEENLTNSSVNVEDNGNLVTSTGEGINNISEEKLETDSKCNLKELKTALKNIIKEEECGLENVNEDLNENFGEGEFIFKGKMVDNETSKEGWDDFDFSDSEDENVTFKQDNSDIKEESKFMSIELIKKNKETPSDVKPINNKLEEGKCTDNILREEHLKMGLTKPSFQSVADKFNVEDQLKKGKSLGNENKKHVSNEIIEIKPVSHDVWDWDTWDEVADSNEEMAATSEIKTSELEKSKEDLLDISKWSGWDNFGQKLEEKPRNWSLGSWGVDMLLNKATTVTQGISSVLEAGLGAPDPETLAKMENMERENIKEERKVEIEDEKKPLEVSKKNSLTNVNLFPVSGITSLVAEVTSKIVEHSKIQEIGSKVINGGLDTLETFGKKTMEVLQEGDPGLKNKRALLLGDDKPVLSQVLREARDKADRELRKAEERESAKKFHFETLFDDFQGMVHLEALEMLSRQYELKLEQLKCGMSSEEQEDFNSILEEVEQLCSLDECDMDLKTSSKLDFKIKLQMAVEPLKNEISIQKIIQIHEEVKNWLQMAEIRPSFSVVNQKLVSTLAELAAATVQQFHKSGELLSVKECRKTVEEVDALLRLTNVLCAEIKTLCEKFILFSKERNSEIDNERMNSWSENVTTIMTNSTSYIRQAFNLLIPVLQFGAAVY